MLIRIASQYQSPRSRLEFAGGHHDAYLSETHRNHPGTGCLVGALAGDVARSDKRTRAVLTKQVSGYIGWLADLIHDASDEDQGAARSRAIMIVCALVGALTVSRAVSDEQLSRENLDDRGTAFEESAS
jgi:TetR/AcrR family transcriptional regulator, transcriptional repressor for nem operon